jgi:Spy/CpxP family protein refolding chaperone
MKPFNTIKAIALASALSISAVGTVALAQTEGAQDGGARAHAWHKGGRGGGHGEFFAGLNLTDAQKQQIQQIHESHRATLDPLMQEMRAKRQELRQLQDGATFDEALVRQKLTDIAGLEAKMMGEQFRMRQEAMAVLTPEQKTQLEQRREQFKQRWSEHKAGKGRTAN